MKNLVRAAAVAIIFVALAYVAPSALVGQTCGSEDECRKLIQEYEQKLTSIRTQKSSLAAEVEFANTQIYLTTLRVQETEKRVTQTQREIDNLGNRIEGLNTSLDHLSRILLSKIIEGYKKRDDVNFLNLVLDSENAAILGNKLKYMKTSQENDSRIAFRVQQAKLNFEQQKSLREDKKVELDALKVILDQQKANLDNQKAHKQKLFEATQNDERIYQSLLAKVRAEQVAIRAIIAGAGQETQKGPVNEGDKIASIIPGASTCSSGGHLHFETVVGTNAENPANHLSQKDVDWDLCGWYGCDQQFSFTGNMPWPINDRVTITQPFGETEFAKKSGQYRTHTGIDMHSPDLTVKSTQKGTAYDGSLACGGGTLTYVKVVPDGGGPTTYYLHVYW